MHGPNANQRVISHCRIVSKIGAGGMGEVYLFFPLTEHWQNPHIQTRF